MAYLTDVTVAGGSALDAAWARLARLGCAVWAALIRAQERRARIMIEVYQRDGLYR